MQTFDPHRTYLEGNLIGATPVRLVIALYEGAIDNLREARRCLELCDPLQRSKFVNKAQRMITELMVSLNHEKGGEIAARLKRLYAYMQSRISEGHLKQTAEPFLEVEKLLVNLLEGWYKVEREEAQKYTFAESQPQPLQTSAPASDRTYGGYFESAAAGSIAATF